MNTKMIVPIFAVILAVASAGMVGAPMGIDMTDQGAQEALNYAMVQYNRASNDAFVRGVSEVFEVQRQVVAGLKYIFTVKLARTSCRKGGVEIDCVADAANQDVPYCKIVVWSQSWKNSIKVMENTCP